MTNQTRSKLIAFTVVLLIAATATWLMTSMKRDRARINASYGDTLKTGH